MQPRSLTFLPPPRWSAVLQAGPRPLPKEAAPCWCRVHTLRRFPLLPHSRAQGPHLRAHLHGDLEGFEYNNLSGIRSAQAVYWGKTSSHLLL